MYVSSISYCLCRRLSLIVSVNEIALAYSPKSNTRLITVVPGLGYKDLIRLDTRVKGAGAETWIRQETFEPGVDRDLCMRYKGWWFLQGVNHHGYSALPLGRTQVSYLQHHFLNINDCILSSLYTDSTARYCTSKAQNTAGKLNKQPKNTRSPSLPIIIRTYI